MRAVLLLLVLVLVGSGAPVQAAPPGPIVVSLTFDDGFKDQREAVRVMAEHRVHGTFYLNSGQLGFPRYITWGRAKELQRLGHEVGGHTVNHAHLESLSPARVEQEVCDDREALQDHGLRVRDFAYPYGEADPPIPSIVRRCGYSTGRDNSGLRQPDDCTDCPVANSLPLEDPYRIRGNSSTINDPALLRTYVRQAESMRGRVLLPLVFHHICDPCTGPPTDEEMTPQQFDRFLTWLEAQPRVQVRPVSSVLPRVEQPAGSTPTHAASVPGAWRLALTLGVGLVVTMLGTAALVLALRRRRVTSPEDRRG